MTARRPAQSREQQIAELFSAHHDRLLSLLERRVEPVHFAADGLAFAWGRLLQRPDIKTTDARSPGWVFQVALHKSWELARPSRDTWSLDHTSNEMKEHERIADPAPGPHELAAMREQLHLLDELPARRRQALVMTAAGYTYKELEQHAGMSYTSVNRYLSESRKTLRTLDRQRSHTEPETPASNRATVPDAEPQRARPAPARLQPELDLGLEL